MTAPYRWLALALILAPWVLGWGCYRLVTR